MKSENQKGHLSVDEGMGGNDISIHNPSIHDTQSSNTQMSQSFYSKPNPKVHGLPRSPFQKAMGGPIGNSIAETEDYLCYCGKRPIHKNMLLINGFLDEGHFTCGECYTNAQREVKEYKKNGSKKEPQQT